MANYMRGPVLHLPLREKYRTSQFLNWRKKYRSHIEIIGLVLESVKDNNATSFSIMKDTSINFVQLQKYLGSLIEIGFIETYVQDGRTSYKASEKGMAFLRQYQILFGMLK